MLDSPPANDLAHHRIAREPVGIIDIFIPSQPTKHRLAQKSLNTMQAVMTAAWIVQFGSSKLKQAASLIKLAKQKQAAVRTDPATLEFQLHATVKIQPKTTAFAFTRKV